MGEGVRGGVSSARVSSHLFLSSLLNHYQIYHCLIITKGPGGTPLYRLYRYVRRQRVWFFSRLVWNRVPILTILVLNRVWFVHASLELGMCFRRSYFFIVRWCEQELNRSEIGYEIFDQVWNGIGKITDFQVWKGFRKCAHPHPIVPPPPPHPRPKVLIINSLLVEALQHQVYKSAKTHNVYHRCSPLFVFYFWSNSSIKLRREK